MRCDHALRRTSVTLEEARRPDVRVGAVLLAGLVACGSDAGQDSDRIGTERVRRKRRTTRTAGAAYGRSSRTAERRGRARRLPDLPKIFAPWDYVALGDSLAAGVGADRGYVERYAARLSADTGIRVRVTNLGISGQTSSQLLDALRNDPSTRRSVRSAEVITFNIGINDLGRAGDAYNSGSCGGDDGQRCLKVAVERFEANWDGVTAEILGLSSPGGDRDPHAGPRLHAAGRWGLRAIRHRGERAHRRVRDQRRHPLRPATPSRRRDEPRRCPPERRRLRANGRETASPRL